MTQTEFTQRVLAMQDRLYRVSCTLLRCEADREDAVQSALPDTLRLPIVLHYMEGMDIRTIARTLRIRESAVKSRLHRGREKLRQSDELKELLEDE